MTIPRTAVRARRYVGAWPPSFLGAAAVSSLVAFIVPHTQSARPDSAERPPAPEDSAAASGGGNDHRGGPTAILGGGAGGRGGEGTLLDDVVAAASAVDLGSSPPPGHPLLPFAREDGREAAVFAERGEREGPTETKKGIGGFVTPGAGRDSLVGGRGGGGNMEDGGLRNPISDTVDNEGLMTYSSRGVPIVSRSGARAFAAHSERGETITDGSGIGFSIEDGERKEPITDRWGTGRFTLHNEPIGMWKNTESLGQPTDEGGTRGFMVQGEHGDAVADGQGFGHIEEHGARRGQRADTREDSVLVRQVREASGGGDAGSSRLYEPDSGGNSNLGKSFKEQLASFPQLTEVANGVMTGAGLAEKLTQQVSDHLTSYQTSVEQISEAMRELTAAAGTVQRGYLEEVSKSEGPRVAPLNIKPLDFKVEGGGPGSGTVGSASVQEEGATVGGDDLAADALADAGRVDAAAARDGD